MKGMKGKLFIVQVSHLRFSPNVLVPAKNWWACWGSQGRSLFGLTNPGIFFREIV